MFSILLAIQILISVGIITLVMLQQGKGADMGAGFGAGASGTVFGSRGSGSFLTRTTGILAAVFFLNCLLIASPLVRHSGSASLGIADKIEEQVQQTQESAETAAIADKLEQAQPAADDLPAMVTEPLTQPAGDVPGAPASPVADDLPQ
ncbi:MAG: preprotein translocase subunit SecG [Gammaproteobacteria bacterium]